ncbi:MAG: sugar O-acetyltransferase [Ruminococcus sp.]|nr:sugar O-acetyltransferase [Ruminococcus sp.]
MNIFERELAGEIISPSDPDFPPVHEVIHHAFELTSELNRLNYGDKKSREILRELFGKELDESITLIPPFYTDFGKNTVIGKNCMIQQCCTFFDRGGITIGNGVFIGPKVNLVTLNHDLNLPNRSATIAKPIVIKDNVWIGINATVLQGVTVGENAVIGAGAVVTKDVPPNTVVAGNPAQIIKTIDISEHKGNK